MSGEKAAAIVGEARVRDREDFYVVTGAWLCLLSLVSFSAFMSRTSEVRIVSVSRRALTDWTTD